MVIIQNLPDELLSKIFSYVQVKDHSLSEISSVCKRWRDVIDDEYFWKERYMHKFGIGKLLSTWKTSFYLMQNWNLSKCERKTEKLKDNDTLSIKTAYEFAYQQPFIKDLTPPRTMHVNYFCDGSKALFAKNVNVKTFFTENSPDFSADLLVVISDRKGCVTNQFKILQAGRLLRTTMELVKNVLLLRDIVSYRIYFVPEKNKQTIDYKNCVRFDCLNHKIQNSSIKFYFSDRIEIYNIDTKQTNRVSLPKPADGVHVTIEAGKKLIQCTLEKLIGYEICEGDERNPVYRQCWQTPVTIFFHLLGSLDPNCPFFVVCGGECDKGFHIYHADNGQLVCHVNPEDIDPSAYHDLRYYVSIDNSSFRYLNKSGEFVSLIFGQESLS